MPPTILTPAIVERLVAATAKGLPRRVAARCAGISGATFFKWIAKGRKGEQPYADLVDRLKASQAKGEESLVALLHEHAVTTWQAGAWLLERRYPDRYGQRQRITHEVQLTEEQARERYKAITGKEWGS